MTTLALAAIAVIGFATLVAVCAGVATALCERRIHPPPPDPYREGLDAAACISAAAFALERELHQVALRESNERS